MILSIILSNNSENYELVHFFVVVVPTSMWYFMFMRMWTQEKDLILLSLYLDTVLYNSRIILVASMIDKLNKME